MCNIIYTGKFAMYIVSNNSIRLKAVYQSKCSHFLTIVTILTYSDYGYHIVSGSVTKS